MEKHEELKAYFLDDLSRTRPDAKQVFVSRRLGKILLGSRCGRGKLKDTDLDIRVDKDLPGISYTVGA